MGKREGNAKESWEENEMKKETGKRRGRTMTITGKEKGRREKGTEMGEGKEKKG